MTENKAKRGAVDQFILAEIDSVPHLEALLLIWRRRPDQWPVEAIAQSLYIALELAQRILQDLVQKNLITVGPGNPSLYWYESVPERDLLLQHTDEVYRKELVRISNLIHTKASPGVRDFARAFRFKKERD